MRIRKDNNQKIVFCTIQNSITMVLCAFFLFGCSKDDNGVETSPVKLGTLSLSNDGTCNHSSGIEGTDYSIVIPYSGTQDDKVAKVLVKFTASDGKSDDSAFNYNGLSLNDGSGTLSWGVCMRFFGVDWIDTEVRIETTDGVVSTASKIRIERPAGAN